MSLQVIEKDNNTKHVLINKDCLDINIGELPDVNLILTDLPYFKVKNLPWDKSWSDKRNFLDWVKTCTELYKKVLKPNGRLCYFSTPKYSHNVASVLEDSGFYVSNNGVWKKNDAAGAEKGVVSGKITNPVNLSERFIVAEYENPLGDKLREHLSIPASSLCFQLFGKKTGLVSLWMSSRDSWGSCTPKCEDWVKAMRLLNVEVSDKDYYNLKHVFNSGYLDYDVVEYDYVRRKGKHPCEKPIPLLRDLIKTYTNEGDTVLDFTAGSMSLSIACYLENRNSVCIEKDESQYLKSVEWVKRCSFDNPYGVD